MVNWFGVVLLILVCLLAWKIWGGAIATGGILGGAGKKKEADDDDAKPTKQSGSASFKDIQSYTITEEGHFARASWNDISGTKSLLVLYNNGTRDKDGNLTQGDVQISFKIDETLDKENAKLEGIDKLSDRGKEILTTAIHSLKARFDDKITKILNGTLDFLKL